MVFVALPVSHIRRVVQLLDELRDTTASVYYVPDIFAIDLIQSRSGELFDLEQSALHGRHSDKVLEVSDRSTADGVPVTRGPTRASPTSGGASFLAPEPFRAGRSVSSRKAVEHDRQCRPRRW